MKRVIGLTAVLCAVMTVAGAVWLTKPVQKTPPIPAREAQPTAATVYAVVGEWEGKVAVFDGDGSRVQTVYDTAVRTLPEAEQAKLKNGIPVFSAKELATLLEDYRG